jgi:hypothetical protein
LRQAGFQRVEERTVAVPWTWPGTPEQLWEYFREVTAPFRSLLAAIPPEKAEPINAEVIAAIRRYYDGRQVNFSAHVVLASAEK